MLTVSTFPDGVFGISDTCLSVPAVVGAGGVERIVAGRLNPAESAALEASAAVLRKAAGGVDSRWMNPP